MKGLIFGAGNIGRGFLGLLLAKAGFDVTFVDTDAVKVSALNAERAYPVFVVSGSGMHEEMVSDTRAIMAADSETIEQAIVEADIILTAVGKNALKHLAPTLARGLSRRIILRPRDNVHVTVVACENVQDNTTFLRDLVLEQMPSESGLRLGEAISFPNCVVDRIVPNTLPCESSSVLAVAVEEYFQLAIDGNGLRGAFPNIPGVDISLNLSATLEQKLCTLNMAHAIVGYYGYLSGYVFVHEAMADSRIRELLSGALAEVSWMLTARHSVITEDAQEAYAQKVIVRFQNPHLRDEIVRVARDPRRKLAPDDRLVKPALHVVAQGRMPAFTAAGITAALHYDHAGDAEAQGILRHIREYGLAAVLLNVCGIPPASELGRIVQADYLLRAL